MPTASVLMAEAAALALAVIITDRLGLQQVDLTAGALPKWSRPNQATGTENQILHSDLLQLYRSRNTRIRRIQRTQNQTTDALARRALAESQLILQV
jgi:hypothetical protein